MTAQTLWQVSFASSAEAEDAVVAWMSDAFGVPASVYTDADTHAVTVSVCLTRRPAWDAGARRELAAGLNRIRDSGLDLGAGELALRRLAPRDWAESWKRHFPPLEIGSKLLLRPTWARRPVKPGQRVIVLDPGLSFGTGRHPTTAFCLRQLVKHRRPGGTQSCLDIGTGSGILAIAAVKLGYTPVHAFDYDPEAVRTARQNASRNRVEIPFRRFDVTRLSRPRTRYSLVCANLMADLLLDARERITATVAPQGVLLLAGILTEEFSRVREAYITEDLELIASHREKEWCSGAFRRRGSNRPPGV